MMRKYQGFTLIELAIVIAIIAILAAVAVPRMNDITGDTELTACKKFLNSLQSSSALYVAETGLPPAEFGHFVSNNASVVWPQTLTTFQLSNSPNITSIAGYNSTNLVITTKTGKVVNYYLNGTDVTAVYP